MKVYRDKMKVYRDKLDREAEKNFRWLRRKTNRGGPHGPLLGKSRGPWVPGWVKGGGPMGPRTRSWGAPWAPIIRKGLNHRLELSGVGL